MKIEWTTIESGKNKTNSKINTILENKNKISVFFAENKKHLFWAWMSTMAMAFVFWFANISWTQFSADLMFPSLSNEISDINSIDWNTGWNPDKTSIKTASGNDVQSDIWVWDLDLSFWDEKDDNIQESSSTGESVKSTSTGSWTDDTEKLITDLFWTGETSDLQFNDNEKTKSEEILPEKEVSAVIKEPKKEEKLESKNISNFLKDNSWNKNDNLHWSALDKDAWTQNIQEVKKEPKNKTIFKENTHTVDINLVSYKANLKAEKPEENVDNLHWSMDSFINSDAVIWIWSWVGYSESMWWNSIKNNKPKVEYVVQKTQRLSQSWPWEMVFGLWFLSMILAFFLRRRKI